MPVSVATESFTEQKTRTSGTRILELDGIRAVAILLVLGCHYPGFAALAGRLPAFGWIGVDIFFALSGYLITTILLGLRGRPLPYRTFYSRRMVRILPPYLAVTAFLLWRAFAEHWNKIDFLGSQLLFLQSFPLFFPFPQDHRKGQFIVPDTFRHAWYRLTHLPSLLKNAHTLDANGAGIGMTYPNAMTTYWSLSIEEYFYLLWAPVVLRCSRTVIGWTAVVLCLGDILLRWMAEPWVAFGLFGRFDSLLYGAILALIFERWRRRGGIPPWATSLFVTTGVSACAGLAVILYAIRPVLGREVKDAELFLVFGFPLIAIAASSLVGALVVHSGSDRWFIRIWRSKAFLFIGTVSYTMYLVHIIAGAMVLGVLKRIGWHWAPMSLAIAFTLLTILISYASWHWMEKPLLRWKDRRFPNSPHPSEPTLD